MAFVARERRLTRAGRRPLLDLGLLGLWGVAAGVAAVATIMAAYSGFDLSGLILTASLVGQVVGVAALTGIYLSASARDPARALQLTTTITAAAMLACGGLAWRGSPRARRAVA